MPLLSCFSHSIMCSRSGLFPMGNIGLGMKNVYGCNLVPSPPARITAFIYQPSFYWPLLYKLESVQLNNASISFLFYLKLPLAPLQIPLSWALYRSRHCDKRCQQ